MDKFALTNAIYHLEDGYDRFFKHLSRFPKYKCKHKAKRSYTTNITNGNIEIYKYFHRKLLERGFVMANETPLQVLHEAGRRAQTKSYMWLFRSGEDDGPPIILYKYSETRSGNTAAEFLDGFHGYLMCDGYSGYNKVPDIKRTACWAHIRRYLTDAVPQGKKLDYNQPAVQGILYIELFRLEEDIKAKHTTFDAVRTHNFAYVFKHISEKTGCSATARIE